MRQTRVEGNQLFSSTNKKGQEIKKHAYIQMISKQDINQARQHTLNAECCKTCKTRDSAVVKVCVLPLIISVKQSHEEEC